MIPSDSPIPSIPPPGAEEANPNNNNNTNHDNNNTNTNDGQEKHAKKRSFVIQEIITTELTYIERLKLALEYVITPLRTMKILDQSDIAEQFDLLEKIYKLHTNVSVDGSSSQNLKFVELFNEMAANFDIYTNYLVNYEPAMQRRGYLLTSNRRFADFIAKMEKDPLVNQSLESLLILPVQRIPRYRLLLEQLLKYTPESHADYNTVKYALDKICALASYNNEAIRARENKNKIMNVMMQIDPAYRIDLLDDEKRKFLREGPLLKQCRKRYKEFQFWLFSDRLLYGEKTPLGTYALNRQINLSKCKLTLLGENDPERQIAFIIESPAKSFKIKTRNEEEKQEWVNIISDAINKQRSSQSDNTLVAPLWKPDANSNQCEVCSESFTLLFRRHHCRNCGILVCVNCSSNRFLLRHLHATLPVRVCQNCYQKLSGNTVGDSPQHDPAIIRESNDADPDQGDSDDDLDERASANVNEVEREEFRDFMKKVESCEINHSEIEEILAKPPPSETPEARRGIRIALPFIAKAISVSSIHSPVAATSPSASTIAASPAAAPNGSNLLFAPSTSPTREPTLWPFRRASSGPCVVSPPIVQDDSSNQVSPPPAQSPAATSPLATLLKGSSFNNPVRAKTLAEEVIRSYQMQTLKPASRTPPPKPPRRTSRIVTSEIQTTDAQEASTEPQHTPEHFHPKTSRRTNIFVVITPPDSESEGQPSDIQDSTEGKEKT
eukprot:gene7393-8178_t